MRSTKLSPRQVAAGIDVISDGEMSKPSYTTYIRHRVSGIEPDPRAAEKGRDIMMGRDLLAHPDFASPQRNFGGVPFPGCVGELRYRDRSALDRDIAHLKAAAAKSRPAEVFMTAPSPGILTRFIINLHYPNEDAYVAAFADVMRHEYTAIVEAGFCCRSTPPTSARRATTSIGISPTTNFGKNRRTQHRRAQCRDRRAARRPHAAAHLLGQLRRPAQLTICRSRKSSTRLQGAAAGDQHRGRQPAARSRMGRPRRNRNSRRQDPHSRRHRLDHEFRRASAARRPAHRPLCEGRSTANA